MTPRDWILAALLLSAGGCGSQPAQNEQAATPVEQGAPQVQPDARAAAEGARRGRQPMAQGSATPVPFEALVALLPEIPGWTRSEPRGENVSRAGAYSRAEARYSMGESRLHLVITDTALSETLIAPVAMFMAPGYAERSTDGYTRATTVGGYPAAEDWNRRSRRGEVTVLVARRFVVKGSGDDVPEVKVVQQAVEMVDFGQLAALK